MIDFVAIFLGQAHGTLVCGDNGGGVPELLECESGIDISVGTLTHTKNTHTPVGSMDCPEHRRTVKGATYTRVVLRWVQRSWYKRCLIQ